MIKILDFTTIPMMDEAGAIADQSFATLGFFDDSEKQYAQLRVPVSELPEGAEENQVLTLTP